MCDEARDGDVVGVCDGARDGDMVGVCDGAIVGDKVEVFVDTKTLILRWSRSRWDTFGRFVTK